MKEQDKPNTKKVEKPEEKEEKKKSAENPVISEDLVKWMTEGTNPYLSPRSDCG